MGFASLKGRRPPVYARPAVIDVTRSVEFSPSIVLLAAGENSTVLARP
jgi:hypothetical protein